MKQVYYDPRAKVIFSVKRQLKRYIVIGGLSSPYLNDAHTSYLRYRITKAYFKTCSPIDEGSKLVGNDGVGFRLLINEDNHGSAFKRSYGKPQFKYLGKESSRLIEAHKTPLDNL